MKYIIMCGGNYKFTNDYKQLYELPSGEKIVERTIRLLKENGVDDIAISSNHDIFKQFNVPVLYHDNSYVVDMDIHMNGYWVDAFYPTDYPVCYIFGDVVFSERAIRKIVNSNTDDIEFFASAPPFAIEYPKEWAEPFALKVVDTEHLKDSVEKVKLLQDSGSFSRKPIMWELWQVIKGTPLNSIDYLNYCAINDFTCDVDYELDLELFKNIDELQ